VDPLATEWVVRPLRPLRPLATGLLVVLFIFFSCTTRSNHFILISVPISGPSLGSRLCVTLRQSDCLSVSPSVPFLCHLVNVPTQAPKFTHITKSTHITPILKPLHWLKVNERIEYKLLSLTYKVLTTAQPSYLHNLISLRPPRSTRSSSVVTFSRPPTISSLKITDRSFRY